jgi:hypothetical protein
MSVDLFCPVLIVIYNCHYTLISFFNLGTHLVLRCLTFLFVDDNTCPTGRLRLTMLLFVGLGCLLHFIIYNEIDNKTSHALSRDYSWRH